jgi:hypothetical protein
MVSIGHKLIKIYGGDGGRDEEDEGLVVVGEEGQ